MKILFMTLIFVSFQLFAETSGTGTNSSDNHGEGSAQTDRSTLVYVCFETKSEKMVCEVIQVESSLDETNAI